MMATWRVWSFELWGNPKDDEGCYVNNSFDVGTISLPDDMARISDSTIIRKLRGVLLYPRVRVTLEWTDDDHAYVNRETGEYAGYPIGKIVRESY